MYMSAARRPDQDFFLFLSRKKYRFFPRNYVFANTTFNNIQNCLGMQGLGIRGANQEIVILFSLGLLEK